MGEGGNVQVADVEAFHGGVGAGGVEGGEDVGHVVTRVGENDSASRMLIPVAHVIHLVVVNYPSVLGSGMLLDLLPGELFLLVGGCGEG